MRFGWILAAATAAGVLAGGSPASAAGDVLKLGDVALQPIEWSGLNDWADDDQAAAFST